MAGVPARLAGPGRCAHSAPAPLAPGDDDAPGVTPAAGAGGAWATLPGSSLHANVTRPCRWCGGPIPDASRVDARYCAKRCRQAAHRAGIRRVSIAAADRPARLAYADPPYPGLARRYYADHPAYGGEVDHRALVSRLQSFDGWALHTSARALPAILGICAELGIAPRVAAWVRGPRPHATAAIVNAWEPVLYRASSIRRVGIPATDS